MMPKPMIDLDRVRELLRVGVPRKHIMLADCFCAGAEAGRSK